MEISSPPILKKLGLKAGMKLIILNSPQPYNKMVGFEKDDMNICMHERSTQVDFIHLFFTSIEEMENDILKYMKLLSINGMMWISWPKKNSHINTDLSRDIIRETGLRIGLVDVKICAVDDTWSGLKFVYRLKDR